MTSPTQGEVRRYRVHATNTMPVAGQSADVVLASDHDATVARLQAECERLRVANSRLCADVLKRRNVKCACEHTEDGDDVSSPCLMHEDWANRLAATLQAELSAAKASEQRLAEALRQYGWHDIKKCDATNTNGVRFTDIECTCGFDAVLSKSKT